MPSEQSFQDRVQRSGELRAAVALFSPAYAPPDPLFTLAALTAAIDAAAAQNANVDAMRVPYQDPTYDRNALVKTIGPLVTQSLAYVKSNTGWAIRHEAVKKAADKVRGVRPSSEKPLNPEPDKKSRESGERSFVEIAGFLKAYNDRIEGLGNYEPPDSKIAIDALNDLWTALDAFNKAIPLATQALADAIADRQNSFNGPTGLKFVFDGVKGSVKGQYGQASLQYKAISGMRW